VDHLTSAAQVVDCLCVYCRNVDC